MSPSGLSRIGRSGGSTRASSAPTPKAPAAPSRWSSRRPTSPARCTSGTCSSTPRSTSPSAGTACAATTPSGCPAPTTPASPPRCWSSASLPPRAWTAATLGRDEFEKRVWAWKERYGGTIKRQMIRLGASCDWSRERFTLDPGLSRAVREVFVRLYEKGLIYRGEYMVNWCPRCHTALSDLEVAHDAAAGNLWHIRYPVNGAVALPGGRHHAARDHARRHRRAPSIPRTSATAISTARPSSCRS